MDDKELELEKLKLKVETWKKTIDVQQHFNDLAMKVRHFGILVLTAFISVIGVSLKYNYDITMLGFSTHISAIMCLAALIIWNLIYFVDAFWYHPLLKGAVIRGTAMENEIKNDLPEIYLTQEISNSSPINFLGLKALRSSAKANVFYICVSIILVIITISLFCFTERKITVGNDTKIMESKLLFVSNDNLTISLEQLSNSGSIVVPQCKKSTPEKSKIILKITDGVIQVECRKAKSVNTI